MFCDYLDLYNGMSDRDRIAILIDLLDRKVRALGDAKNVAVA